MKIDKTKDRRINIRLDEDTYFAIKKAVEDDLKTDISSYCRSLLRVSTLHESSVHKMKKAIKRFNEDRDMQDLEYMLAIKNEIGFLEKFLTNIKENRKKYDDFISMIEKKHETITTEARKYFSTYNDIIDELEANLKDFYGDEYDSSPTHEKPGDKIII
ncbi:MAG: hypothetical protein GY754_45895 [bacterium]|nr:hypothetical protein [bacterium]